VPGGRGFGAWVCGAWPPQVFEAGAATRVHPLVNRWSLAPVRPEALAAGASSLLLAPDTAAARPGDRLLVLSGGSSAGVYTSQAVSAVTGRDGNKYKQVTLDHAVPSALLLATTRLLRPTATVALWSNPSDTSF